MNKFRLWLMAHGLEFELSDANFEGRSFGVVINHRYIGIDVCFHISLYRCVYTDELNKSHAEIAAERIAPLPEPSEHDRHVREDAEQIAQLPAPTRTALSLMLKAATDGTPRNSLSEAAQRALEQFNAETAEVRAELVNMIADFQQQEQAAQS